MHLAQNNPPAAVIDAIKDDATPNPVAALELILAKESESGHKMDNRKATNLVAAKVHEKIKAVTGAPRPVQDNEILNRCFFTDCNAFLRDVLAALEAGKVIPMPKFINLDPPYGSYKKLKDGKLDVNSSAAAMLGGSNLSTEDAIKTTVETITLLGKLLKYFGEGTTLALWQNHLGLRLPILQAIEDAGLEVETTVIWVKKNPQAGAFTDAYSQAHEQCIILKKKGGSVVTHEHLTPHGDVPARLLGRQRWK